MLAVPARIVGRLLREPLVHFFVLAVLLLAVQQRFLRPAPRQRIVVSPDVVRGLRQDFVRRTGGEPAPAEAAALLERYLDNEVLYREALAQGLDRGDIIVRRRLIQKMEFVLEASEPIAAPSDAELQQYLDTHAERYAMRDRVALTHVFVGTDRHGEAAESQAAALQAQLAAGADPTTLGDPFLRGREFKLYTETELAGRVRRRVRAGGDAPAAWRVVAAVALELRLARGPPRPAHPGPCARRARGARQRDARLARGAARGGRPHRVGPRARHLRHRRAGAGSTRPPLPHPRRERAGVRALVVLRVARAVVWAQLFVAAAVAAHSFEPLLFDVRERAPGVFDVRWRLPGPGAGLVISGDTALSAALPPHCRRVDEAPGAASTDQPTFLAPGAAPTEDTTWRVDCGPDGLRGYTVGVDGLAGGRADAVLRIVWRDGETLTTVLHGGAPAIMVPPGRDGVSGGAPASAVFGRYLQLGIEHILFGFDHLLFVFGLLLLVDSTATLVKTVSAFTVAHSVSLALAVLGVVHVSPALVETLIAASIVLLAAELARPAVQPAHLTRRAPWVVAFAFGLLHGLGFAGALAEIGVPANHIALALLSFNLGVEIGQLVFVLAMAAPVAVAARIRWPWPELRLVPVYAMGALAMLWTLERLQALFAVS